MMVYLGKWLCKLGIHSGEPLTHHFLQVFPVRWLVEFRYQCRRCSKEWYKFYDA